MNESEAMAFLKAHQPLPPEKGLPEDLIQTFDEVRKYFIQHPNPACIPLFLNAFGDGMGFGVYQLCDDVLGKYPTAEVAPHLASALRSPHAGVRWWAAHWSMEFPDPCLVEPLAALLDRPEDEDAYYFALASLGAILGQTRDDRVLDLLRRRHSTESDPERAELLQEILEEHG